MNDKNRIEKNIISEKHNYIFFLWILIAITFLFYFSRLFSMQVIEGDRYRMQSKTISSQVNIIPAQRGEIFDRNYNLPLVVNTDSFAINVTPGEIPSGLYDTVAEKLAQYLSIS